MYIRSYQDTIFSRLGTTCYEKRGSRVILGYIYTLLEFEMN